MTAQEISDRDAAILAPETPAATDIPAAGFKTWVEEQI